MSRQFVTVVSRIEANDTGRFSGFKPETRTASVEASISCELDMASAVDEAQSKARQEAAKFAQVSEYDLRSDVMSVCTTELVEKPAQHQCYVVLALSDELPTYVAAVATSLQKAELIAAEYRWRNWAWADLDIEIIVRTLEHGDD